MKFNLTISGYDENTQTTGSVIHSQLRNKPRNLYSCDSVDEFIQYSIDGGDLEYILSNITFKNPDNLD